MIIIAVEGIDYSGKSTQIELVRKILEEKGKKVAVFEEPGDTPENPLENACTLAQYALNTSDVLKQCEPFTIANLFCAQRTELYKKHIATCNTDIVLTSRCWVSTAVYQWLELQDQIEKHMPLEVFIKTINALSMGDRDMQPIVVYIQIDIETMLDRKTKNEHTERKFFEQQGIEKFKKRIERYDILANSKLGKDWVIVDGTKDEETVTKFIIKQLKERNLLC